MPKPWKAIAAMSLNRVIGKDNTIPWHIPRNWKWVKERTNGQIVVMGRKTFDSIGKPLPNRENIVLSRTLKERPEVRVIRDLAEIESLETDKEIWIFGGEEVYRQALPHCDEIFLTVVNREVEGDTFFPEFEEEFDFKKFLRQEKEFRIKHYVRSSASSNLT